MKLIILMLAGIAVVHSYRVGAHHSSRENWGSMCTDSSKPTCTCADGTDIQTAKLNGWKCGDDTRPTCLCDDGSAPKKPDSFSIHDGGSRHSGKWSSMCTDSSSPTCTCADGTDIETAKQNRWKCGDESRPSCLCDDGTAPKKPSPCSDGSQPTCQGACANGSDAVLNGDWSTPPCADSSRPDMSKCVCANGEKAWSGFRGHHGGPPQGRQQWGSERRSSWIKDN